MNTMHECLYPHRCHECPWIFTDECLVCPKLAKYGIGKTPWGEYRFLAPERSDRAPANNP